MPHSIYVLLVIGVLVAASLACNVSLTDPNGTAPTQGLTPATANANGAATDVPTLEPPTRTPFVLSATPTSGPTEVLKATPSYVPATATAAPPTVTPVPTVSLSAKVCATCVSLRVREQPDTSAKIIVELPTNASLNVIGRTNDGQWFRVTTQDGQTGWAYAPFITVTGDIYTVNIINIAGGNTPTPITAVAGSGSGGGAVQAPAGAPSSGNIITGITSKSRQIFLAGQAKGNLPAVFTRVGDSITAAPQFLHQFATDHYNLGAYGALDATVGYFSSQNGRGANPFLGASLAEHNNWTTADILNPDNAPKDICNPGETPISCEYRLVRPSVSVILIGTNDAARDVSPEQFQANLQRIVQISMDMGVVPVLTTLPPKHLDDWNNLRVDQFNGIIVAVARGNDIPLCNLWLALQNVPNNGIQSDGVHLNAPPDGQNVTFDDGHLAYGYPVRNLIALQALDALRRQVLYGGVVTVQTPGKNVAVTGGGLSPGAGVATARPCDGAPLPRLYVGGKGRVTPGMPNKLRAGPHKIDTVIGSMPGGAIFSVIGGPVCGDGLRWWQITYNGLNAWTADGQGAEYWLEPAG